MRHTFTNPRSAEPGDVIIGTLGLVNKSRPWIILWMDDETRIACLAPCTRSADYPGTVETGWEVQPTVMGSVVTQPYTQMFGLTIGQRMPYRLLKQLRRRLRDTLDLD